MTAATARAPAAPATDNEPLLHILASIQKDIAALTASVTDFGKRLDALEARHSPPPSSSPSATPVTLPDPSRPGPQCPESDQVSPFQEMSDPSSERVGQVEATLEQVLGAVATLTQAVQSVQAAQEKLFNEFYTHNGK